MPTFLGIDCGGSSTRTCLIDSDGAVLHRGQSGPANLASTPQLEIERHIREALAECPSATYATGCFAGLLTDADRYRALNLLETVLGDSCSVAAYPDYHASLAAESETDVIVIAGTGALIASRDEQGTVTKSAGGGPLLGDFGSAFDVGRKALGETVLAPKPSEASPMFWESVVELFGTKEPNQVLASVYRSVSPAARVAKLAPVVVFDALRGLPYAKRSVDSALDSLAANTTAHISAHCSNAEELKIRLAGGLWDIDEMLSHMFRERMLRLQSESSICVLNIEPLKIEPVIGAVHLAKELAESRPK
ncbi:MAG: hypothetical protein KF836_12975 [Fimbriimonadaceae bacterium]|nr:hypothetical protein [Fimbriimonadaceae bacterium]